MRDPGLNTVTTLPSVGATTRDLPAPWDPLAEPSVATLEPAGLALWPRGPAFGSPDGEAVPSTSNWAKLTRALLSPFATLYRRAWLLARESSPALLDQTLSDWERDYGLPEPCITRAQTRAERIAALRAKVDDSPLIGPGDFIRLAASYGFTIEIEEPAVFECGFSECGGEHTTGDWRQEIYWIVRIGEAETFYFRVGEGELGSDPLFSYGDAEELLCLLLRFAPAWTIPVLELAD